MIVVIQLFREWVKKLKRRSYNTAQENPEFDKYLGTSTFYHPYDMVHLLFPPLCSLKNPNSEFPTIFALRLCERLP